MSLSKVTDSETIAKLQTLNERVQNLQNKYIKEAIKIDSELLKRVQDKEDILDDYELKIYVEFYLKEDDPNYQEDEDNCIATLCDYGKKISQQDQEKLKWRWEGNHNEFTGWINCQIRDENHCWWYHCLYDHNNLSVEELLSIGTIWCDIKVQYQYFDKE